MTAPSVETDLLAHNFNLGTIDFFAYFKKPEAPAQTLLHELAREGDVLSAEALIEGGADCDLADDQGRTPLHEAAAHGHTALVCYLLDSGTTIDAAVPPFGHTALYLAVEKGHTATAQLLASCGARLDAADVMSGQGLLHLAASRGDMILSGILIAAGIDVMQPDRKGRTARDYAAKHNHKELERALLKVMEHRAR